MYKGKWWNHFPLIFTVSNDIIILISCVNLFSPYFLVCSLLNFVIITFILALSQTLPNCISFARYFSLRCNFFDRQTKLTREKFIPFALVCYCFIDLWSIRRDLELLEIRLSMAKRKRQCKLHRCGSNDPEVRRRIKPVTHLNFNHRCRDIN